MNRDDLLFMIREVYIGNGLFQCPSGTILPVFLASPDRIDTQGPYSRDNVRILSRALNMLRKTAKTDKHTFAWLQQARAADQDILAEIAAGCTEADLAGTELDRTADGEDDEDMADDDESDDTSNE